jgi:hypothetical protein
MNMELPELEEGLLDEAGLRALCHQIQTAAQLDQVLAKGAPRQHTPEHAWELDQALQALIDGGVRGVQLRYRYDGHAWFDTVLRGPDGFRVVRMRQG